MTEDMGNYGSKYEGNTVLTSGESNYFSPFAGSSTDDNYASINSSVDDPSLASGSSTNSRTRSYGLPLCRAVFVVANAAIGAGMLNFPQAYEKSGGLVNALTVQTVSFVANQYGLVYMIHCRQNRACCVIGKIAIQR